MRKFQSPPSSGIPCTQNVTIGCNGTQSLSWHCSGTRTSTVRDICNFKDMIIFSVDLASRAGGLEFKDLPMMLYLKSKELCLHSVTLWNGSHYICIFKHSHMWLLYV